MYKNAQHKYSLLFNKGDIYEMIRKYLTTFDDMNNLIGYNFKTESKDNNGEISKEYKLIVKAPYGDYPIIFNNQEIWVSIRVSDDIVGTQYYPAVLETLVISTNKDQQILYDFVEEARKYCESPKPELKETFITISQFDVVAGKWVRLSQLKKRKIDSVLLDKNQVDSITNDIDKFLQQEDIYDKYGIPYKRNYLLYGLPGTGKTSLIFSLASHYNMNVAIFSFVPSIDDTIFMKCINSISNNSILVLEDIDGVFIDRHKDYNNKSMISFSGVLNTLDGMGRKHKLITFMTTNYKEQLDPVILRPGRIDYKLEFTYATNYQISKMYDFFIENKENKEAFMKAVKNKQITTCVLQKFFFEYRESTNIIEHINILYEFIDNYSTHGKNLYT